MQDVWTPERFGDALTRIFRRSVEDAEFRRRCLATPDAAIEEVGGAPIPSEYRGKVQFTETPAAGQILLPAFGSRRAASDELTDTELELVAGGGSPYCMFTNGCYCMCTGLFTEGWG
jgi:hypothetical protein